jgi:hypothetical protein
MLVEAIPGWLASWTRDAATPRQIQGDGKIVKLVAAS